MPLKLQGVSYTTPLALQPLEMNSLFSGMRGKPASRPSSIEHTPWSTSGAIPIIYDKDIFSYITCAPMSMLVPKAIKIDLDSKYKPQTSNPSCL